MPLRMFKNLQTIGLNFNFNKSIVYSYRRQRIETKGNLDPNNYNNVVIRMD